MTLHQEELLWMLCFGFVSVVHRLRRPTGDEAGVLRPMFVLLNLHFCFLLGHDFSRAAKG
jgi:hypothetical protein